MGPGTRNHGQGNVRERLDKHSPHQESGPIGGESSSRRLHLLNSSIKQVPGRAQETKLQMLPFPAMSLSSVLSDESLFSILEILPVLEFYTHTLGPVTLQCYPLVCVEGASHPQHGGMAMQLASVKGVQTRMTPGVSRGIKFLSSTSGAPAICWAKNMP